MTLYQGGETIMFFFRKNKYKNCKIKTVQCIHKAIAHCENDRENTVVFIANFIDEQCNVYDIHRPYIYNKVFVDDTYEATIDKNNKIIMVNPAKHAFIIDKSKKENALK